MLFKGKIRPLFVYSLLVFALVIANVNPTVAQGECNSVSAPLVTTGDISAADTDQTLRMFRDGRNTTCLFNRTQTTSGGTYDADSYTFTNDTGGPICVSVDLDATGCGVATNQISFAAYSGSYNPASILTNIIADPGLSTGQNFATSMSFSVPTGGTYVIVVHNINAGTTCPAYTFKRYITNNCRNAGFDFANDGKADLTVFRPSGALATWSAQNIGTAGFQTAQLGSAGDIPVGGDYAGDESSDFAVFRPSNGTWYPSTSPVNNYGAKQWGISTDLPVQGDYDRDGITDFAVFRPSENNWYVLRSSGNVYSVTTLGTSGDKPVPADYDGDGRTDPAVFRPSNGLWTVLGSSGNYGSTTIQRLWGLSTDIPIAADFDGDGKADTSVFRPSEGNWYVFRSSLTTGNLLVVHHGSNGDIPQPADYDGDRKDDYAVFRPSDNTWYVERSSLGYYQAVFGQAGDIPATSPNRIP